MLKIGLIIGSTRPNRFADIPAAWIVEGASARSGFEIVQLDLRDQELSFFEEPTPPAMTGGVYSNAAAEKWCRKIAEMDGFIATVAEYNHGPTAVLKNAFDSAYVEWQRKPIAFVGYGGVGGARAIEHLRGVAVELQMAPLKHEINLTLDILMAIYQDGKNLNDFPRLLQARGNLFSQIEWWASALKGAR